MNYITFRIPHSALGFTLYALGFTLYALGFTLYANLFFKLLVIELVIRIWSVRLF